MLFPLKVVTIRMLPGAVLDINCGETMGLSLEDKKRALIEPIEISIESVLNNNDGDISMAISLGEIPAWRAEELACERLVVYQESSGKWILDTFQG